MEVIRKVELPPRKLCPGLAPFEGKCRNLEMYPCSVYCDAHLDWNQDRLRIEKPCPGITGTGHCKNIGMELSNKFCDRHSIIVRRIKYENSKGYI